MNLARGSAADAWIQIRRPTSAAMSDTVRVWLVEREYSDKGLLTDRKSVV